MRIIIVATSAALFITALAAQPSAAAVPIDDNTWNDVNIQTYPLQPPSQAPADEYFGRQKISNLGIRNMVHDMTIEGTSPLALPRQVGRIEAIQDAFGDWLAKYPADRWLPGQMYWFARFLQTRQQPVADSVAIGYLLYINTRFGSARIGRNAGKSLDDYQPVTGFDLSETPMPDPHDNVGDYLFPTLK
jgi:hypothetical protein